MASRSFVALSVAGPEGMGRTSLLDAFAGDRGGHELPVIRAHGGKATQPFSLVRELSGSLRTLLEPASAAAATRSDDEKATGPTGLAALLRRCSRDRPLLVLIDDLDRADAESLSTLRSAVPLLVAPSATLPADERGCGGLLLVTGDQLSLPDVECVELKPLSLDSVRHWMAEEGAERALSLTGGLPGRLQALLGAEGAIDFAERRLARLSVPDREVLLAVSLLEGAADAESLRALVDRRDVEARLKSLVAARLASASPGVGRTLYALSRPGDAALLCGLTSATSLQRMRLAAAEFLLSKNDHSAAFALFTVLGDARAAATGLCAARDAVGRQAYETACDLLSELVCLATGDEKAEALLLLADAEEGRGQVRRALAALGRVRALVAVDRHPSMRARCARLCIALGAPKAAERLARRVLADESTSEARADATVALADARFLRGAYDEVLSIGADELEGLHARLLANTRGKALLTLGRLDEARTQFTVNAEACERTGDRAEGARALLNLGVVAHRQGDRHEARSRYREALGSEAALLEAIAHANLSSLALEDGDASDALLHAHRALGRFAAAGRLKEQAHAAQNLARIYLYLGDSARAAEVSLHSDVLASKVGDPYVAAGARLVQAEVQLAQGAAEASTFGRCAESFRALKNPRYERESWLLAVEAALSAGSLEDARSSLGEARRSGAADHPPLVAEFSLLEAEFALASRDLDAADSLLAVAGDALLSHPHLELPSRWHFLRGALAAARGLEAQASLERLKAVRLVEELGAKLSPDARPAFFARRRRRDVLEAAGHALREVRTVEASRPAATRSDAIVGESPAILRLHELIARIGPSDATVLVRGESGTGKELVARALHEASPRREMPLVAVNCGALNEELLLSELFGHEKGSFTGAIREKKGRFELADGGTIFLDEIGDISPRAQVALLRALQERSFERVGGTRTLTVDVRVVCATNRPLEALMAKGQFREDLYYRLRGATLTLPPLRERGGDVPLIAEKLLAGRAGSGRRPRRLSPEAVRLLQRHAWPGNVRELMNVIESALLFATGDVLGPEAFELSPELFAPPSPPSSAALTTPSCRSTFVLDSTPAVESPPSLEPMRTAPTVAIPAQPPVPEASGDVDFYALLRGREQSLKDLREELETHCIKAALREGNGNISEAARLLGMKRSRLSQIVNADAEMLLLSKGGSDSGLDDGPDLAEGSE